jgi:hypothetical protein
MPLTLGKAALKAGVSKPTMSSWLKSGKVSGRKDEKGIYQIDEAELDRFLAFRKAASGDVSSGGKTDSKTHEQNAHQSTSEPTIEGAKSLTEVKFAAALEIVRHERESVKEQLKKAEAAKEAAEQKAEEWQERYIDVSNRMTALLEDQRPKDRPRQGFLTRIVKAFRSD